MTELTPDDLLHTIFVTISKKATKFINGMAVSLLFGQEKPHCWVRGDPDGNPERFHGGEIVNWEPPSIPIYLGMSLILTQNLHKNRDYVTGMRATTGQHLILDMWTDSYNVTYLAIRVGYATTLQKVQGTTLPHVTLWLNVPGIEAAGYVALSRVEYDANWRNVGKLTPQHFVPMSRKHFHNTTGTRDTLGHQYSAHNRRSECFGAEPTMWTTATTHDGFLTRLQCANKSCHRVMYFITAI